MKRSPANRFRYQRNLSVSPRRFAGFCRRHHLAYLGLFGSVVHDDFGKKSDVDVLYEFQEGKTPGRAYFDVVRELERLVGRKVDFVPRAFLNEPFRSAILPDVETIYDESNEAPKQGTARAHR